MPTFQQYFVQWSYEIPSQLRNIHQRIVEFVFAAYLNCRSIVNAAWLEITYQTIYKLWLMLSIKRYDFVECMSLRNNLYQVIIYEVRQGIHEFFFEFVLF